MICLDIIAMIDFALLALYGIGLGLLASALFFLANAIDGSLDHLFFYRLLDGESGDPHWLATPVILTRLRPYHVMRTLIIHPAVLTALYLSTGLLVSPTVAALSSACYFIGLLHAIPDAAWYHVWTRRIPFSDKPHEKAYPLWPVQQLVVTKVKGRMILEREYRSAALGAYSTLVLLIFTCTLALTLIGHTP